MRERLCLQEVHPDPALAPTRLPDLEVASLRSLHKNDDLLWCQSRALTLPPKPLEISSAHSTALPSVRPLLHRPLFEAADSSPFLHALHRLNIRFFRCDRRALEISKFGFFFGSMAGTKSRRHMDDAKPVSKVVAAPPDTSAISKSDCGTDGFLAEAWK